MSKYSPMEIKNNLKESSNKLYEFKGSSYKEPFNYRICGNHFSHA